MELINFDAIVKRLNKNDMTLIFDHSDEVDPKQLNVLRHFSNCIVHLPIGFTTEEATATKQESFARNIESFLKGSPNNVVRLDFRIVRTPLTGPGYEPMIVPDKHQWAHVHLRPIQKHDIKHILRLDNRVYPTADPVGQTTMESWYIRNPELGMVYDVGGKSVGAWAFIPLNQASWKKVIHGKLSERAIGPKHLFDITKDTEIGLHIYHVEKLLLSDNYYIRILNDIQKLLMHLRIANPKLRIAGLSTIGSSSPALGLFQNRFNFQEKEFVSTEHIFLKGKKLIMFDEKDIGQKGLSRKLDEGFTYYQKCKMLILEPNDFSLVWSHVEA
jgi:hypothetical protein